MDASVVVRGAGATTIDERKLDDLVQLELGRNTDVDEVVVDVSKDRASIALQRRGGGSRAGVVDLPASGSGDVERTVALFIGELSREPDVPVIVEVAPVTPSAPASPPSADVAKTSRLAPSVLAGGTARMFASDALVLGPFLSGGLTIGERVRLNGVGRYGVASTDVSLGSVYVQTVSIGASAAYQLAARGRLSLDVGAGIDLGWIGGRGEGSSARTASGYGVTGTGFLEARWNTKPVVVALAIEGGWLAPGLDLAAGGRTALAMSGPFAGASLGGGFE